MKPPRNLSFFSLNLPRLAVLLLLTLSFSSGCDKTQGVKIGDTAPGFSGTDIRGEFISLKQFKGNVLVLYFWTNSCCGDSLKKLEPVYRRNNYKGLSIAAINEKDSKGTVESFAKENGLTFTLLTDEHSMLYKQYQVLGFPTVLILDRNGIIREKILGEIQTAQLEKLIQRQLEIQ